MSNSINSTDLIIQKSNPTSPQEIIILLNSNETSNFNKFIADLRNKDPKIKLIAIKGIINMMKTLEKERIRKELIPYITECIEDEDYECLIELAAAIPNMLNYIGGKQHIACLLKVLEGIVSSEEQTVRLEVFTSF